MVADKVKIVKSAKKEKALDLAGQDFALSAAIFAIFALYAVNYCRSTSRAE